MTRKKYPPKIQQLLERNGFFDLTVKERQKKHQEFIKNVPKVLNSDEKICLIKTLGDNTGRLIN